MEHLFIVGLSEDVEAEYGVSSDETFTLVLMTDGDIILVEGFATMKALKAELKADLDADRESYEAKPKVLYL